MAYDPIFEQYQRDLQSGLEALGQPSSAPPLPAPGVAPPTVTLPEQTKQAAAKVAPVSTGLDGLTPPAKTPAALPENAWKLRENETPEDYLKRQDAYETGDFKAGLASGWEQTKGLGALALGALGQKTSELTGGAVGNDLQRWGYDTYQETEKAAAPYLEGRTTKIEDIQGPGDALDWFGFTLGNVAPSIAESVLAGGIGAVAGASATPAGSILGAGAGAVGKGMVRKFLTDFAEKQVVKGVARDKAEKLAGAAVGAGVGTFLSGYQMGVGDIYSETLDDTGKGNATSALLYAIPYAGIEALTDIWLGGKLLSGFKGAELVKRVPAAMAEGGLLEGSQEVAQEAINLAAGMQEGKEYTPQEVLSRLGNSLAAGFLPGAVLGGAGGIRQDQDAGKTEVEHLVNRAWDDGPLPGWQDPAVLHQAVTDPQTDDVTRAQALSAVGARLASQDAILARRWNEASINAIAGQQPISQVLADLQAKTTNAQTTVSSGTKNPQSVQTGAPPADQPPLNPGAAGGVVVPAPLPSAAAEQPGTPLGSAGRGDVLPSAVPAGGAEVGGAPLALRTSRKPVDRATWDQRIAILNAAIQAEWTRDPNSPSLPKMMADLEAAKKQRQTGEADVEESSETKKALDRTVLDQRIETLSALARTEWAKDPQSQASQRLQAELSDAQAQRRALDQPSTPTEAIDRTKARQISLYQKALAGETKGLGIKKTLESPEFRFLSERLGAGEHAPDAIHAALNEFSSVRDQGTAEPFPHDPDAVAEAQAVGISIEQLDQAAANLRQHGLNPEQIKDAIWARIDQRKAERTVQHPAPSAAPAPSMPSAQTTPQGPTPPADPWANVADYIRHNLRPLAERAEQTGIAEKVADLSAEYKTAREIAKALNIDEDIVRAVRIQRRIPSWTTATRLSGAAVEDPEFTAWREAHLRRKAEQAPTNEPLTPPVTTPAPTPEGSPGPEASAPPAPAPDQGAESEKAPVDQPIGGSNADGLAPADRGRDLAEAVAMARAAEKNRLLDAFKKTLQPGENPPGADMVGALVSFSTGRGRKRQQYANWLVTGHDEATDELTVQMTKDGNLLPATTKILRNRAQLSGVPTSQPSSEVTTNGLQDQEGQGRQEAAAITATGPTGPADSTTQETSDARTLESPNAPDGGLLNQAGAPVDEGLPPTGRGDGVPQGQQGEGQGTAGAGEAVAPSRNRGIRFVQAPAVIGDAGAGQRSMKANHARILGERGNDLLAQQADTGVLNVTTRDMSRDFKEESTYEAFQTAAPKRLTQKSKIRKGSLIEIVDEPGTPWVATKQHEWAGTSALTKTFEIQNEAGETRIIEPRQTRIWTGDIPDAFLELAWDKWRALDRPKTPLTTAAPTADPNPTPPTETTPTPEHAKPDWGANNTLVTRERMEELRKRAKAKLGQLNAGIDPEMLAIMTEMAAFHLEAGARRFAEFARTVAQDLEVSLDQLKPYLRVAYNGGRDMMEDSGLDITGIDDADVARTEFQKLFETTATLQPDTIQDQTNEQAPTDSGREGGQPPARGNRDGRGRTGGARDDRGVAPDQAADGGAPGVDGDSGGVRAPDQLSEVGGAGAVPGRGDAVAGQQGTGEPGLADLGAGGARGGRGTSRGGRGATARAPGQGGRAAVDVGEAPAEGAPSDQVSGQANDLAARGENFHAEDPERLYGGTPKVRFGKNKRAIEILRTLDEEGRPPTADERETLAGYTGWGSFGQELFKGTWERPLYTDGWTAENDWLRTHLGEAEWKSAQASIINAHYTDPPTVQAIWAMVQQLGFQGGRVLEPSMGVGNFFALMPKALQDNSRLTGIEMDALTASIARHLYPQANLQHKPYQDSQTPDDFYDLVIGNWPFAKQGPADRRYNKLSPSLHDYFFLKALDQVRPGGLVVGITSRYSLDQVARPVRMELSRKAELVAAYRLPSGAFEQYAGTKVVTDILILKKRETPNPDAATAPWTETAEMVFEGGKAPINRYYHDHPEHILGTLGWGSGTTYGRAGVIVERPTDLLARLQAVPATLPTGVYTPAAQTKPVTYIANNTQDRTRAVTVGEDGQLYQVQGEVLAKLSDVVKYVLKDTKKTAKREAQLKALVGMRRAYGALLDAEREGAPDMEAKRKALREQYDAFVKDHGSLNESEGLGFLKKAEDPFYPSLAGLEHLIDGAWKPMAVLSRPVMRARATIAQPSVTDAYALTRNEGIAIDMARIAEMSGVTQDQAERELLDKGAVFRVPGGGFTPSDVYLSGNVRRKLREAQAAAEQGEPMTRNLAELEKVIPKDVPYFNIESKLGAQWVKPRFYQAFVNEVILGNDPETTSADDITAQWRLNRWVVQVPDGADRSPAATRWRNIEAFKQDGDRVDEDGKPVMRLVDQETIPLRQLVQAAFNNGTMRFTEKDADGNVYTRSELSAAANEKAGEIREAFEEWVWKSPERKVTLERDYNEIMNAIAPPQFDGSFLSFTGMALQRGDAPFNLRQHQVNAIWRGLVMGSGLYAHEVGTGKSYSLGGVAVESRRFGLARKPLILGHNANSRALATEIQEMYPGAKVLYVNNLEPKRVKITLSQIANDDWDAVVMPHSLLDKLALKGETLEALAADEIAALEQAFWEEMDEDQTGSDQAIDLDDADDIKKLRNPTAKELANTRLKIRETITKQAQRASEEGAIAFEDLGVDMLIVDEAHLFRKPPFGTRMKMRGLNKGTSNRSVALKFLVDYIKRENNGRGVHLFTGTPINNTLNEIFHMQRYIMQAEMKRDGIDEWDSWFNTFASGVSDVEYTAAGDYKPVTKLAGFINVAELRRMMSPFMDVVFADEMPEFSPRQTVTGKTMADTLTAEERDELLNGRQDNPIGRPYKKVLMDVAEMSPAQQGILAQLQDLAREWDDADGKTRLEWMKSGDKHSPILIEGTAARVSMDARMEDLSLPDDPNSKVNRAVRNLLNHYHGEPNSSQVVFMDKGYSDTRTVRGERVPGLNLAKDLVEKLVAKGVPRAEIAIVAGGTTAEAKKAIADAVNAGTIRIVIGQTETLGTGVNMQRQLRAMHHLDAPWMPGELEQRNGRGWRQGNTWNTVLEYRYITERIDGKRWQVLAVKDRFIKAFLQANEDVRVIEGDAASDDEGGYAETLSEAVGDPRLLVRQKLKADVQKLQRKERVHAQGVVDAQQTLARNARNAGTLKRLAERATQDAETYEDAVIQATEAQERAHDEAMTQYVEGLGLGLTQEETQAIRDHGWGNKQPDRDLAKRVQAAVKDAEAAGHERPKPPTTQPFQGKLLNDAFTKRLDMDEALKTLGQRMPQGRNDYVPVGEVFGFALEGKRLDADRVLLQFRSQADPDKVYTVYGFETPSTTAIVNALRGLRREADQTRQTLARQTADKSRLEELISTPFSQQETLDRKQARLADIELDMARNPVPPPAWLRHGAPIDAEVYLDGKPWVVEGHQMEGNDYFVFITDGKNSKRVGYLDLRDSNGGPLFDPVSQPEEAAPAQDVRAENAPEDMDWEGGGQAAPVPDLPPESHAYLASVEGDGFTREAQEDLAKRALLAYQAGELTRSQYTQVRTYFGEGKFLRIAEILDEVERTGRQPGVAFQRVRKAKLEADIEQMLALMAQSSYSGGYVDVAIKETLQNSFDAVKKVARATGKPGRIDIRISRGERTVTMEDNGVGMTAREIQKYFLTLGGTGKGGIGSSGGMGLAKGQFLTGAESFELVTTKDGQRSTLRATPKEVIKGQAQIVTEDAPAAQPGTKLTLKVPAGYLDGEGVERSIFFPYDKNDVEAFKHPLIGPVEVFYHEDKYGGAETTRLPMGVHFDAEARGMPLFTKANFSWGTADIYFGVNRNKYPKHLVLSDGIYQFDMGIQLPDWTRMPYDVIVDIHSSVKSSDPRYPFNNTRQGFRASVEEDAKALRSYLIKVASGYSANDVANNFKEMKQLPRTETQGVGKTMTPEARKAAAEAMKEYVKPTQPKVVEVEKPAAVEIQGGKVESVEKGGARKVLHDDAVERAKAQEQKSAKSFETEREAAEAREKITLEMGLDRSRPVFHNNTSVDYIAEFGDEAAGFFAELGTIVVEVIEALGDLGLSSFDSYKRGADSMVFGGVSIDKSYRGVHVKVPYTGIFVNPLAVGAATSLPGFAESLYLTLVHEGAHQLMMDHNERHTLALHALYERFADRGLNIEFAEKIGNVLYKYRAVYNPMRERFDESSTRNVAQSLTESAEKGGAIGLESPGPGAAPDAQGPGRGNLWALRRRGLGSRASGTEGLAGNEERTAPGTGPRFNLADGRPSGDSLSASFLQSRIDAVTRGWTGLARMPVKVVSNVRALPEAVRSKLRAIRQTNPGATPRAVYVPGDGIYLVASNLGSVKEALLVLAEEAIGHYGARAVFGPQFDSLLDQIASDRPAEVAAMAREYGLDMERQDQRREAAEEYMAHLAENPKASDQSFLQRLYQAMRNMLRNLGFSLRLSDGDLREILFASRRYLERGDARESLRVRRRFGGAVSGRSAGVRLNVGNRDALYLAAVERGDLAEAQRMVKEAAEEAGVPVIEEAGVTAYRVRRKSPPQHTQKAYKLFRVKKKSPGEVFALFVGSTDPLPQGVWLDAISGPQVTNVDPDTGDVTVQVKSTLGNLAYRPGWHAGDLPLATHIGALDAKGNIIARKNDEVWAEVEMADDHGDEYQKAAIANGTQENGTFIVGQADIKYMPEDGLYRYKTNPNMTGQWIISGSTKINRILSEDEVNTILREADARVMPWAKEVKPGKEQKLELAGAKVAYKAKMDRYKQQIATLRAQSKATKDRTQKAAIKAQVDEIKETLINEKVRTWKTWAVTPLDLAKWGLDTNPAVNQKKLLDPVTYDDQGQVIPLSQRFNAALADPRFSLANPADSGASPLGGGSTLLQSMKDLVTGAKQWAGDAGLQALPKALGAFTLDQLRDLGQSILPGIKGYTAIHKQMEVFRNDMIDESGVFASDVWDRWARKNKDENERLMDLMNDTTKANVDPSNYKVLKVMLQLGPGDLFLREREATEANVAELARKARELVRSKKTEDRGMAGYYMAAAKTLKQAVKFEKQRQAALPALQRRWNELSKGRVFDNDGVPYQTEQAAMGAMHTRKDLASLIVYPAQRGEGWVLQEAGAQEIYKQARDLYRQRSKQMMQALIDRIKESTVLAKSDQDRLIAQIRAEFESTFNPHTGRPKVDPYFPLQRFGRWFTHAIRFPEGRAREWFDRNGVVFASQQAALSSLRQRKDIKGIRVSAELADKTIGAEGGWVLREVPEPGFWTYDSVAEQNRDLAALKAEGWQIKKQGLTEEARSKLEAVSEGFMASAVDTLKDAGDAESADALYQMYLGVLHQMSSRKHFIHRKKTAGYSRDQLRAFGWNMTRLAHQISKAQYLPKLERILREIKDESLEQADTLPDGDLRRQNSFMQELEKRHAWIANPTNSAFVNFANGLGFTWFLGFTPGAALVNLTQTPIVALPVLAGRFNDWGGASKALGKAFLDVSRGFNPRVVKGFLTGRPQPSQAANLTQEERAAFEYWDSTGVRDRTRAHNLAGIGDTDTWTNGPTFNRAMAVVSSGFHAAEVINRDVTLLAAYRMAREKGFSPTQAQKMADEATWEAHFNYSNANRARFMQSGLAKVVLMFRSYAQHITYFLWRNFYQWTKGESAEVKREARTKLLGVLGMTGLFSGALGMPLVSGLFALLNVLAAAFGDDDEPWEAETEFRNLLASLFPTTVADIIARGPANTITGADFASRVSLSQLWWRDPDRDLDGAGAYQYIVEQLMGPLGGIASSPFTAADLVAEGQWQRAAETVVPKFVRDGLQAIRYAEEGVLSRRGDPVVADVGYAWIWKGLGMNPAEISLQQDVNASVKRYERSILDRRSRLMTAYALASIHQDFEVRGRVAEKIRAFNEAQPEIPIRMANLKASIRNRKRYSDQAEDGIVVNRRLGNLKDEVGAFGG